MVCGLAKFAEEEVLEILGNLGCPQQWMEGYYFQFAPAVDVGSPQSSLHGVGSHYANSRHWPRLCPHSLAHLSMSVRLVLLYSEQSQGFLSLRPPPWMLRVHVWCYQNPQKTSPGQWVRLFLKKRGDLTWSKHWRKTVVSQTKEGWEEGLEVMDTRYCR